MAKAKKGKKKGPISKVRVDRNAPAVKNVFEPITIVAENCRTVILMLRSPEDKIVLQAIGSLDKHASKGLDACDILLENDVLGPLPPLLDHPHLCVRRFTMKLMAQLCKIAVVREMLLAPGPMGLYFNVYAKATDVFIQEYSAALLAELTRDILGCDLLLNLDIYTTIFERLKATDADVQHNTLLILRNLLRDSRGNDLFRNYPDVSLEPIVVFFNSEFPAIQKLAIEVLHLTIERTADEKMQNLLRESETLEMLFDIIENPLYTDLHEAALNAFGCACDNAVTAELVVATAQVLRLVTFLESSSGPARVAALQAVARIARLETGRRALMELNIIPMLLDVLSDKTATMDGGALLAVACEGLTYMAELKAAILQIMKQDPVEKLFEILANREIPIRTREFVAMCLSSILKNSRVACQSTATANGHDIILDYLSEVPSTIPYFMSIYLVDMLMTLSGHQDVRGSIIQQRLVDVLISGAQDAPLSRINFRLACCQTLTSYLCEAKVREWLSQNENTVPVLLSCLRVYSVSLRIAAATLIQRAAADPALARYFIRGFVLDCLVQDKIMRKCSSIWESAIEAILDSHLPAKFAYTGRLDIRDVIKDKFYLTRRSWIPFPELEFILEQMVSPLYVVYLIDAEKELETKETEVVPEIIPEEEENVNTEDVQNDEAEDEVNESVSQTDLPDTESEEEPFTWEKPEDIYLPRYIADVKDRLCFNELDDGSTEQMAAGSIDASTIAARAMLVAQYVVRVLSGPEPDDYCNNHLQILHLNELKHELMTNAIPIGFVRLGSYIERSVLFKVICDKVGIPCALVRGRASRMWNEVAIPEIDQESLESPWVPSRLLRPSHIVDLMIKPGRLLQLDGLEAARYRGLED